MKIFFIILRTKPSHGFCKFYHSFLLTIEFRSMRNAHLIGMTRLESSPYKKKIKEGTVTTDSFSNYILSFVTLTVCVVTLRDAISHWTADKRIRFFTSPLHRQIDNKSYDFMNIEPFFTHQSVIYLFLKKVLVVFYRLKHSSGKKEWVDFNVIFDS